MPRKLKVSPFVRQCFVTAAVGNNVISNGCSLGFPAILLPQLRDPGSGIQLTKEQESWIASMTLLFLFIGSFVSSPIMDRLGRKAAHYSLAITFIVGWLTFLVATDVAVLVFARAVMGISSGQIINLRSVLIGEYTSPRNRGAFLTTISLAQTFGIFFVHFLGTFFSWQITAVICSLFPFTSFLMIIYSPESPSWLAKRGRYDECREAFRWLRGEEEENELNELIKAQTEIAKANVKSDHSKDSRIRAVLRVAVRKEFYKPIILTFHANALMQFSGASLMSIYTTNVLNLIMGPTADVYFWMIFIDAQRIMTNLAAVYANNRFKRRTMLFTNGVICVINQMATAAYVFGKTQDWTTPRGLWLPALLVNIQTFVLGMAIMPIPQIIAGELFPLAYRGIGSTITLAASTIVMFTVVKTFLGLIDAMGLDGAYLLFSIIMTYCLVVLWIFLPETKGKTLQQIEDELRGRTVRSNRIDALQPLQITLGTDESTENKEKV